MAKQYGLILPGKAGSTPGQMKRPTIFDEDSDSDNTPEKPSGITKHLKKQDKIMQVKAMEEDPTVYQYDEIYDEMDKKRQDAKQSRKDLDRKPKYINKLLVAADRRKRENERRIERQVQKEREAEGEEFKDKESFVTSAYKKKLEEMKELEEQEKREEYLESIGDVRKQGNLDGFYRHLYDQKVNYEEKLRVEELGDKEPVKKDSDDTSKIKNVKSCKKRRYRQNRRSSSDDDGEQTPQQHSEEIKKEHLPSNLDADSDFSIDSSDSEDETNKPEVIKEEDVKKESESVKDASEEKCEVKTEKLTEDKSDPPKQEETNVKEEKETKPKIDIWKKRTVGEVFDAALQRYFERKAIREAGCK